MSVAAIDASHDPSLTSWVESANTPDHDFPIQNLPFGVFRPHATAVPRGGVAIGDEVCDLAVLYELQLHPRELEAPLRACAETGLNRFMAMGVEARRALRQFLSRLLRSGAPQRAAVERALRPQSAVSFELPAAIGDFTDFYTSIHHATAIGRLLRPDAPLLPNYKWVPIAYHGRASSIRVSGHDLRRPVGQTLPPGASRPQVGLTARLDYEL
ncbi:MAG: fumarylacetoacetase, partial [Steroidobacteraceae bacterium]|nr:fumarylacetoacetase [Steroidobacteraceae bacterium]MDW8258998.1 fumarylacetoacetase [Gammaproteobacteria bacterium]